MTIRPRGWLWALLLPACGTQYSDPIREELAPAQDPCSVWTTELDCRADTQHGCSFQPNDVGCSASDPNCAGGVCRGGDPFVRRIGQTLWLRDSPYSFVGAVSWGIAWDPDGCQVSSLPDQTQALARTFDDLAAMRAAVLKIWAFQSFAGPTGTDYASFERIVTAARRAGVRLIFVLENHWADCSSGGQRDDAWYSSGYLAPYGSYALSYRDYVVGLVEHFRDEPTLLGWELMHEARAESFAPLDGFSAGMSALVRERDPNHLIALGLDNGGSPGTGSSGDGANYSRLHQHPAIDLADVHDFDFPEQALPPGYSEAAAITAALRKAIFAGATAVELSDFSGPSFQARAEAMENKLAAAMDAGFVGFLLYDYFPDWDEPGWRFDGRAEEPLAGPGGVIARHAR